MSSDFNFTSWFLGNVHEKPISTHSAPPPPCSPPVPTALHVGTPPRRQQESDIHSSKNLVLLFFCACWKKRANKSIWCMTVCSVVWKYSVYRVIQYTSIPDSQASLCITAQIFFFTFSFFQYFIKVEIKCNIMHSYLVLRLHFHLIYRSLNSSLGCSPPAFTNSQSQISRCQFLPKSSFIEINSLNSLTYQLFRLERHI